MAEEAGLERQSKTEVKRSTVVQRIGDDAEIRVAQLPARFRKLRRIGEVEGFGAELKSLFVSQGPASRNAQIDIPHLSFA